MADQHESSQRCAAEIIAGMIRGTKHWSFHKVSALWESLIPLIRIALVNITVETIGDWGICFATASVSSYITNLLTIVHNKSKINYIEYAL